MRSRRSLDGGNGLAAAHPGASGDGSRARSGRYGGGGAERASLRRAPEAEAAAGGDREEGRDGGGVRGVAEGHADSGCIADLPGVYRRTEPPTLADLSDG